MVPEPALNSIAYVGGQYLPLGEARVPILDRGFLFGDGVYEVCAVYQGRAFALADHLQRLSHSLRELAIANPHTDAQWTAIVHRLIKDNAPVTGNDLMVYLQVTRGAPPVRQHAFPAGTPPTVVGMCSALPIPGEAALRDGVGAITRADNRWGRCDIKSTALLANVLAVHAAREQGCNEAILHRDGRVTEGGSSNVFAVLGTSVITPSKSPEILSGITRDLLVAQLRANKIPVQERRLTLTELRSAEEIWLTSSTREVLPVTRIDGEPVGGRKPGPLWKKAYALFQAIKKDDHRYG
ncbi:MAG TPA: D-amino acid aminotransferase [Verrucomicrobiae bacterium]|nr:D-amino acid aminotransferase [Verrucomicrobiae bacterium]